MTFAFASEALAPHAVTVLLAAANALLGCVVALDLSGRARRAPDRLNAALSIFAGAVAMGTGIWSMHFVGMSAVSYPFDAGFEFGTTLLSWLIAVVVCVLPLAFASGGGPGRGHLARWACAAATGGGIAVMHFIGVRAMVLSPAPAYDLRWIVAATAISALGGGLALERLDGRRGQPVHRRQRAQIEAGALFGLSLTALHFLAMASTSFASGTVCTSSDGIRAQSLSYSIGVMSLIFLGLMSLVATVDRRAQRLAEQLTRSLLTTQRELERVKLNDPVTGLPNRLAVQERLLETVRRCEAGGGSMALLLIEIDDFGPIGRALASESSNQLLRACAERLRMLLGPSGFVGSAGTSQFMVLASTAVAQTAGALATGLSESVARELRKPFEHTAMRLTCSIGIALYPGSGAVERLAGDAGVALDAARNRGGNGYAFFEPGMDREAREINEWLHDLRLAVERDELALHYQPKVQAKNGRISGVEALLRWNHPTRGQISPTIFIPLAERFGLINEIGDFVLVEAARQMAIWVDQGIRMKVAVNVSVAQLLQSDFVDKVLGSLDRFAVDPELLTCEITESGAMQEGERTLEVFERLRAAGIHLSIDDFGTGYSSLSYLRRIPLSQLKIDRSFVNDLSFSADARSIATAIVEMAHALRLEVVAEGVETSEQRDILLGMGCDKFQGFLFARPMLPEDLSEMMADLGAVERRFSHSLILENIPEHAERPGVR